MDLDKFYKHMKDLGLYKEPEDIKLDEAEELYDLDTVESYMRKKGYSEEEIEKELEYYEEENEKIEAENERKRQELINIKKTETQVYEFSGCKIIIYPDNSYDYYFEDLDDLIYSYIVDDLIGSTDYDTLNTLYNDKELREKLKDFASEKIKENLNTKSVIISHIYGNLIDKNYKISRLTDYRTADDISELLDDWLDKQYFNKIKPDLYFDENGTPIINFYAHKDEIIKLFIILKDTFGEDSKIYNEFLSHFNGFNETFKEEFYNFEVVDNNWLYKALQSVYIDIVLEQEILYMKYINQNVEINISLKEAYDILSPKHKSIIYEEIFSKKTNLNGTTFTNTIVDIFQKKCKNKEGKVYDKNEIINFLKEISYAREQKKKEIISKIYQKYDERSFNINSYKVGPKVYKPEKT